MIAPEASVTFVLYEPNGTLAARLAREFASAKIANPLLVTDALLVAASYVRDAAARSTVVLVGASLSVKDQSQFVAGLQALVPQPPLVLAVQVVPQGGELRLVSWPPEARAAVPLQHLAEVLQNLALVITKVQPASEHAEDAENAGRGQGTGDAPGCSADALEPVARCDK
jgi:hypothetical protein